MPIFEYICSACRTRFDALVFSDEKVTCEACGSSRIKKQFSTFAVQNAGRSRSQETAPGCAAACAGGFQRGACGSGMCGG